MNNFDNFEYGLQDMDEMTVTLTLEDDTEMLCGVVAIFPAGDRNYIALTPISPESDEVFIYRFNLIDADESILEYIEDGKEYEIAGSAFEALTNE